MRQAYNNARFICKLDEHWLSRAMSLSQESFEEEDDDSEEFEEADSQDILSVQFEADFAAEGKEQELIALGILMPW